MDLREYFNKLFDEMFVQKEREMGVLAERNSRLRTILSELRITCNGQSLLSLTFKQPYGFFVILLYKSGHLANLASEQSNAPIVPLGSSISQSEGFLNIN